jgi:hypothetical protein
MSRLLENEIADTILGPFENFMHAKHTLVPVHEEIDDEATMRSKRQRTAKSFGDDFTIYLMDDTHRTISETFASTAAND